MDRWGLEACDFFGGFVGFIFGADWGEARCRGISCDGKAAGNCFHLYAGEDISEHCPEGELQDNMRPSRGASEAQGGDRRDRLCAK